MSYEKQDASLRIVGVAAALVTLGIVASLGVSAWWYQARYDGGGARGAAARQTSFAQGAAKEPDIQRDQSAVDAEARARLESYAWVDREAGVVRIPIERAMALLAAGVSPAPGPKEAGQVP
jgi:hypothetical protein